MSGTVTHLTVGRDLQSARVFLLPCDSRPQHPEDVWLAGSHPWELRPEERWAVPTQAFRESTHEQAQPRPAKPGPEQASHPAGLQTHEKEEIVPQQARFRVDY